MSTARRVLDSPARRGPAPGPGPRRRGRPWALGALAIAACLGGEPSRAQPPTPVTVSPPGDPEIAELEALNAAGRAAEAEALGRRLLAEAESRHEDGTLDGARIMDALVTALARQGRASDPETRRLAERCVAATRSAVGPDAPDTATALDNLAALLREVGDSRSARAPCEEALAIRRKALGPDHADVATSLNLLGLLLKDTGDFAGARLHFEEALRIRRRSGPDRDADLAEVANNLASLVHDLGELKAARVLYEEALAILRRTGGPDHPQVATAANNLGLLLKDSGDFAAARPYYEEALAIRERTLGPDHPDVASSLNNLARLDRDTGDVAGALPLLERALSIQRKRLRADDPRLAVTLNNLARVLRDGGDIVRARPLAEEALALRRASLGPEHPDVAPALGTLAALLRDTGDFGAARALLEEALAIQRKALGSEHRAVAATLSNLANLLRDIGDRAAAKDRAREALAIRTKTLGADHVDVAGSLDSLAGLEQAEGNHAAARPLLDEALRVRRRVLGGDHPDVAESLNNLGSLLRAEGDLATALALTEEAAGILERMPGPAPVRLARVKANVALSRAGLGDTAGALASALDAESMSREHLAITVHALSEREALRHASSRARGLDVALSVAAEATSDRATARRAWDAALRGRGVVFDALAARRRDLPDDPASRALASALKAASQRLANLWVAGPGGMPAERWLRIVDDARAAKERAERALAASSPAWSAERARKAAGLQEVAAALPADTALVASFAHARVSMGTPASPANGPSVPSYIAFVLRGGGIEPVAVPLGPAVELDRLVEDWRAAVVTGRPDRGTLRRAGIALRERAWDPLAPHLAGARRIYLVPDGALHLVSLPALPAASDGWLVESEPIVHLLSNERDLLGGDVPPNGTGLLAFGGPDFSAGAPSRPVAITASSALALDRAGSRRPDGRRSACADFAAQAFAPLPGAEGELADTARRWRARAPRSVAGATEVLGAAATESALAREAPGKRVIHLATHGFFLESGCAGGDVARGIGPGGTAAAGALASAVVENPLLHCGLALAGANERDRIGPDGSDGILTAEEIASLDLSSCEWAVLSACGTGLGAVQAGEGVLGLQRAFAMAGARTVVMSLWSVDDEATRRWMRELYRARLERNLDTAECVREASLAVLRDRRDRGLDDSPFWWGAFVASGDWR